MSYSITAVNDFVVKFANINGSGSASANQLFSRAILRMGVPASPRNIFPSNIQGLPTWYEVRISERGYCARRGGCDFMVAMNPQSWDKDVAEIEPGGYLLYDNTKLITPGKMREDIHVMGIPLTQICNDTYGGARQRQLLKNIMYVGALSAILQIDPQKIEDLIAEQYKGKEKLLAPNIQAMRLGRDYALKNLDCAAVGLKVQAADAVGDKIFIEGNEATALGCIYGGATVCAWYPITPSSSVAEAFQKYCDKYRRDPVTKEARFAVLQAEDELASIGMVLGACWNGARAFTCTSGPGISLMSEFLGFAYFAEVPATIINVQRVGPSTGMPTRTQQGDLYSCAYASHADCKHVLLFPEDPRECFEFAAMALDLADRLQTPVFVMSDLDIGMNSHLCEPLQWEDGRRLDRGKVISSEELLAGKKFSRYLDVDGDGISYRTYPGTHPTLGAYFTRGSSKDREARYTEVAEIYADNMEKLARKFNTSRQLVPLPIVKPAVQRTESGVIYFGSTSLAMTEALNLLRNKGLHLDAMRLRAFPFPQMVMDFIAAHEHIFVVEQNRDGQMRNMLITEGNLDARKLTSVLHYDGLPITAGFIAEQISRYSAIANTREEK